MANTDTRIHDYLDGELSPAQASAFEAELARDPALKAQVESLQSVVELLHREGPVKAPQGFHERVMAELATEPMPQVGLWDRVRSFFRSLPMETVAMAVAAAIVLVLVGRLVPTGVEEPAPSPMTTEGEALTQTERAPEQEAEAPASPTEPAVADLEPETEKAAEKDPFMEVAKVLEPGPAEQAAGRAAPSDAVATLDLEPAAPEADAVQKATGPELGAKEAIPATDPPQVDIGSHLNAAVAYQVKVGEAAALRNIATLAERHGGRAYNATTGKALRPADFDNASAVQVQVRIPPAQLAAFASDLQRVGAVQKTSMNDVNLYGPDTISVNLDVRLQ
ncbi:MAG: hypothetical protein VX899_08695 [Myxococcota bacterium]|nr:hypothetical protein [Myxococcota bacterium]